MTIYVDPFARVVETGSALPPGWVIPRLDVSPRGYQHNEVLPHGVVVAFSSKASLDAQLRRKYEEARNRAAGMANSRGPRGRVHAHPGRPAQGGDQRGDPSRRR